MSIKVLVLTVVITIAYLMYSLYHLFVTKKKKKLTMLDIIYVVLLTLFTGLITKMLAILVIGGMLCIWLFILLSQADKNSRME